MGPLTSHLLLCLLSLREAHMRQVHVKLSHPRSNLRAEVSRVVTKGLIINLKEQSSFPSGFSRPAGQHCPEVPHFAWDQGPELSIFTGGGPSFKARCCFGGSRDRAPDHSARPQVIHHRWVEIQREQTGLRRKRPFNAL